MRNLNEQTENVRVDDLQPHPRNPRQGDVGAIYQSLKDNGWYGSVIAQRSTGYILAGNHRWMAARQAGMQEIPVTWLDVDDDHALRILLQDNRANDLASYDESALREILEGLQTETGTLAGTGFDGDDLDDLIKHLDQEFQPNLSPSLELRNTTERDIERAKGKLEGQFKGERQLRETMCPHCGEEFYVD